MNYGRRGIKKRQKVMNSPVTKVGKFCGVSLFTLATFAVCVARPAGFCATIIHLSSYSIVIGTLFQTGFFYKLNYG